MSRLAAELWVQAYLHRLQLEHIPAYVTAKGEPMAGAVMVKIARLDGSALLRQRSFDLTTGDRIWMTLADGPEPEIDAMLQRQRDRDRDLWILEIESPSGRDLLDEPGLSD